MWRPLITSIMGQKALKQDAKTIKLEACTLAPYYHRDVKICVTLAELKEGGIEITRDTSGLIGREILFILEKDAHGSQQIMKKV